MDINLRQVRAFVTVARLKSFTRAAALLHLSQPALTVQIRKLEDALGARLVDRNSRSVAATRIGQDLLPALERMLQDADQVLADARAQGAGRVGTVRLAALPSFAAAWLPELIQTCRQTHPALGFVVRDAVAGRVMELVRGEEVELGVIGGSLSDATLEPLHQWQDRLCLVYPAGHAVGRRRRLGVADLVDFPLVLTDPATSVRATVDAAFQRLGRRPQVVCETTYMMTAVALVRAGLGLTVLPASARELRAEPSLRSRVIDDPAFVRPVSLVKKRSRSLSPAAQHFVSVCVAALEA